MGRLDIKDLQLSYSRMDGRDQPFQLNVPELHIEEGEFFTLLGASGCGKTTLLKTIAGLEPLDRGNILVDGQSVVAIPTEKRGIGMVFQNSLLFPHMNVLKNVCFGLKMAKVPKATAVEWAREALESVGLEGYENRMPNALSGGQQQRVSMARAIVTRPKMLLMDEPFSSLDPSLRDEMRRLIRELHLRYAMTIVFVTHDIDEAFQISDRIALMNKGHIVQVGIPNDLFKYPENLEVAKFMGPINRIQGAIEGHVFRCHEWNIHLPDAVDARAATLMIRPEDLSLKSESCRASFQHCFACRIVSKQERRGYHYYVVDVQGVLLNVVERAVENRGLDEGASAYLVIAKDRLLHLTGGEG